MILLTFLIGLVLVVVAAAFCTVRGVRMWRQLKRTSKTMGAELDTLEAPNRANRDPARAGRDSERRARGGAGATACLPCAPPGAARRPRVGAGAHPLAPRLPSDLTHDDPRRGDRPRDELDPAPRRGRRRRPARGGRPPADDHAARRRSRPASAPPPRSHHARAQLPHGVPPDARGARGASARSRSRRAPCETRRTARRSSARSSGATASRRDCSPERRRRR